MKLIITDTDISHLNITGECKIIDCKNPIHPCLGCFGCWIKTPGECIIHDSYEETGKALGHCSELIIISECTYGSVSPFVKNVLDRGISYIHPYFVIRKGEMHHKRRYQNHITISAYFYGSNMTEYEKETAKKIINANADNYDGTVGNIFFYHSADALKEVTL